MAEQIQRIKIWGGWYRLAHLAMGGALLVLMSSGWLIRNAPGLSQQAAEVHLLSVSLLLFGLGLRLVLGLLGAPVERLAALLPTAADRRALLEMGRFYLSLGRTPLPRWYGHNPLWKPLYLLLYLMVLLLAVSGILMPDQPLLWGWYLPGLHRHLAQWVFWWSLLHVLAVVLQDYRSGSCDSAAMIHGYRLFVLESRPPGVQVAPAASLRLDQIGRD